MIVVTGGLGFIGNELVRQLKAAGETVVVIDNRNRVAPQIGDLNDLPVYEIDITDKASVKELFLKIKPHTVFHLAAIHYIPECNDNPERTLRINVEGTQSLLNASAHTGVQKFLFASSGAVYADSSENLTESSPIAPVDIYGWSKLFGEQLCHLNNGMYETPTVICRLFNNYGPRETNMHIIPEIINQLRSNNKLKLGNIRNIRDYIHTHDCAKALIKLSACCEGDTKTVNVATGEGFTVEEVIQKIAAITGISIEVDMEEVRLRKNDKRTQVADISLLKTLTGWVPGKKIEQGLTELMQFEMLMA